MTMQTLVGIFIFVSRETFILSCVENEQRFITSEPGRVRRKFHMGGVRSSAIEEATSSRNLG